MRRVAVLATGLFFLVLAQSELQNSNVLAFGSCAKQYKSQEFWDTILNVSPRGWLWLGDAIYASEIQLSIFIDCTSDCSSPKCIEEGYKSLESNSDYKRFKEQIPFIDGTWDDHDYGVNDGGKEFQYKAESQGLFLDFLDIPKNSMRRTRDGVYSSRAFSISDSRSQVNLILLDVRTHREQPLIESLGQYSNIPFSSVIAAVLRMLTSLIGYESIVSSFFSL
ncbi:uncharacterized protein LOC129617141 [Condylostylus longicornis]|uniref:uncharacterized protein LOC129617141 n=1 Tax=Condylostylus longicornis TaxID=2530218 RepID=UPI00244E185B|nr:uncharacterized protein LOC129617141 [Condylostylus longicornis]